MLEKLMDLFKLAYRQKEAIYRVGDIFKSVFANGFNPKRIFAGLLAFFEMFGCVLFDLPVTPAGEELDLGGYEIVFCDEFDGDKLDTDVWEFRRYGADAGAFDSPSQVSVSDGKLHIKVEYKEDGEYGAGWYMADLQLIKKYKQGYFEIKCKCNDGGDFWSAFWIQASHPYDHYISNGGLGGAELDIFEAADQESKIKRERYSITNTIHCNGFDDDIENIDSRGLGAFYVGNNIYENYNTYGLKWTEEEYIFYINGIETARSSFAKGTSQVEESVCVSVCAPSEVTIDKDITSEFTVDYVKIWQKAE